MNDKENDLQLIDIDTDKTDPDIKPDTENDTNKNIINQIDGSIKTSDYDELPPLEDDEYAKEQSQNEKSIHIDYSYKGQDVIEGLTTIQALLRFKKNMICTGILLAVFTVYMLDFANLQSFLLGMLCLVVIAIIWIMPRIHIKRFAKIADENNIRFSMDIYSNSIKVSKQNSSQATGDVDSVNLAFKTQIENIIETDNLFIMCAGKERVFIIPKRCIDGKIHELVREIFQITMGENFHQKNIVI